MWKTDMKNALFSKRMLLVTGIIYLAAWIGCFENVRMETRNITQLCEELLTLSSFKRVLPLFSSIGAAFACREEYVNQYWYYAILRTSKKSYIASKIVTNIAVSFLASAAGVSLFCVTLAMLPGYYAGKGIEGGFAVSYLMKINEAGNGSLLLMFHILSVGLYSCTCAMIALAISCKARGKYVVIIGPFLIIEGSNLLFQINHIGRLHPVFILYWSNTPAEQIRMMLICFAISAVCGAFFAAECSRRMK